MPLIIFSAFLFYIVLAFVIGFILAYPMSSAIVISSLLIIGFIHDYRNGSI